MQRLEQIIQVVAVEVVEEQEEVILHLVVAAGGSGVVITKVQISIGYGKITIMASTIKVDNVQNQPGTNVVNKCGTTVNIGAASDNIRSAGNNLQASDGGNLISQSGTDITLGASGDTINLASGATQTGFGRTGTVDWQTQLQK